MPREVYDADGNAIEGVPDEAELKALKEAAEAKAALDTKVTEAQAKLDAYEKDPAYKNFGLLRKGKEDAEKERDDWKTKYETEHPDKPKDFSQEDVDKRIDEVTEKKFVDRYTNTVLSQFGDKKAVVKVFFDKFAAGETLTEEKIVEYAQAAANAAGLNRKVNPIHQAIAVHGSGTPEFDEKEDDFADSEAGKAMAEAMGLPITPPKK